MKGVIPTGLRAQFRRHARPYLWGTFFLAVYHVLAYAFDRGLKFGIESATAGERKTAVLTGVALAIVPLVAMGVRVLSRILIFNGGRAVEYELRRVLLDRPPQLGPALYPESASAEIMSRATTGLTPGRALRAVTA